MSQDWKLIGDYHVEIWFSIEKDKEGYPRSKSWEQLLARPVAERDDYFRLDSIPFYLRNVSRGDFVKARKMSVADIAESEVFVFDKVVKRGGHNTYRLLLRRMSPDDPQLTMDELIRKGMSVELEHKGFLAVDVPPSIEQKQIDDFLVSEAKSGRWEMQDGYLQTINIH